MTPIEKSCHTKRDFLLDNPFPHRKWKIIFRGWEIFLQVKGRIIFSGRWEILLNSTVYTRLLHYNMYIARIPNVMYPECEFLLHCYTLLFGWSRDLRKVTLWLFGWSRDLRKVTLLLFWWVTWHLPKVMYKTDKSNKMSQK